MRRIHLIPGYYLASPAFLLFGLWWGWEVRVSFLPDLRSRFIYYLFISGLGLLAHFRPAAGPWVAMGESTLNLLLILLWILLPIYTLPTSDLGSGGAEVPYTVGEVLVNGLLAGSFFLVGFYQAQGVIVDLAGRPQGKGPRGPLGPVCTAGVQPPTGAPGPGFDPIGPAPRRGTGPTGSGLHPVGGVFRPLWPGPRRALR